VAVHDIDMKVVHETRIQSRNLFRQLRKIGRKNGRRDFKTRFFSFLAAPTEPLL